MNNCHLAFVLALLSLSYSCEHDQLTYTLQTISDPEVTEGRVLQISERQNIRIGAFYCEVFC